MSDDPIKDVLTRMPYGFYSITSHHGDDDNAMVANWLMQVSFKPRLIAMGFKPSSYSYDLIKESGVFAVNLFLRGDEEAMMPFTKARAKRPDKMENAHYTPAPQTGCPILEGAAAYLECQVVEFVDIGGDHEIMVGEVINAGVIKEGEVTDTLTLPDVGWSYAG